MIAEETVLFYTVCNCKRPDRDCPADEEELLMLKYLSLVLTLCALAGFIYGLLQFFGKRKNLYMQMIVLGVGCAMMGRLFETLLLYAEGEIPGGFHIGVLGIIGSLLFFFTANYGQMDSLVDDGSKKFLKYRLIGMIAPVFYIILFVFYLLLAGVNENTGVYAAETAAVCVASYFNLKHLVIEDVDFGIIRSIRGYNLLALLYGFLCMTQMIIFSVPVPDVIIIISYALLSIVMLIFVPVLAGGVKKWTT